MKKEHQELIEIAEKIGLNAAIGTLERVHGLSMSAGSSHDTQVAVKMHQELKRLAMANPHKAKLMGDTGWMYELMYLARIMDAQKEDSINSNTD